MIELFSVVVTSWDHCGCERVEAVFSTRSNAERYIEVVRAEDRRKKHGMTLPTDATSIEPIDLDPAG